MPSVLDSQLRVLATLVFPHTLSHFDLLESHLKILQPVRKVLSLVSLNLGSQVKDFIFGSKSLLQLQIILVSVLLADGQCFTYLAINRWWNLFREVIALCIVLTLVLGLMDGICTQIWIGVLLIPEHLTV